MTGIARSYLLGLAGGTLLASIAGDVPLWLIALAAAVISWDVARLVTARLFNLESGGAS